MYCHFFQFYKYTLIFVFLSVLCFRTFIMVLYNINTFTIFFLRFCALSIIKSFEKRFVFVLTIKRKRPVFNYLFAMDVYTSICVENLNFYIFHINVTIRKINSIFHNWQATSVCIYYFQLVLKFAPLNRFFSLQYLQSGWWGHYDFRCQPVDYSRNPIAMRVSRVILCFIYNIQL